MPSTATARTAALGLILAALARAAQLLETHPDFVYCQNNVATCTRLCAAEARAAQPL